MRAYVIIHDDIFADVAANLTVATGAQVTVNARDWDGETWGAPYEVEVDEYIGGYQHIGHLGLWGAYVLESSGTRLQAIDAAAPDNRWIPLYSPDVSDNVNDTVAEEARMAINAKLTARGWATIPEGWSNHRMLKELYTLFESEFGKDGVLERVL